MPYKDPEVQRAHNKKYREDHKEELAAWRAANRGILVERDRKFREKNPNYYKDYGRKYRVEHKEEIADKNRRWREKNPQYYTEWRAANPEKVLGYSRAYYAKHPELCSAASRAWYAAHPEQAIATSQAYRASNLERVTARQRAWRKEHPEIGRATAAKRRARIAAATIGNQAAVDAVYARALDPKPIRCYYCHEFIPPGERHVDHVWPLSEGGPHVAYNLVIAHGSCNMKKSAKLPEEMGLLL
jgi:5-methylcytosine-specific restriction endonuclease McrA